MMTFTPEVKQKLARLLERHVPATAVPYALDLWVDHPFSFVVARTRSTCLGNYSFRNGIHKITINHDLNPYQFLITYVHEVAHQRVWLATQHLRRKPLPHGEVWKKQFQELLEPLLHDGVFPPDLLVPLRFHMANPPASTVRDARLMQALRAYDSEEKKTAGATLGDLQVGETFKFRNRLFTKLEDRRTRTLCACVQTKRRYTLAKIAVVEGV